MSIKYLPNFNLCWYKYLIGFNLSAIDVKSTGKIKDTLLYHIPTFLLLLTIKSNKK